MDGVGIRQITVLCQMAASRPMEHAMLLPTAQVVEVLVHQGQARMVNVDLISVLVPQMSVVRLLVTAALLKV